jgi:dTDP-glucose 4,6-dehydratase
MRRFKTILVTGGAGFIGCNFIRYLLKAAGRPGHPHYSGHAPFEGRVVNVDALTYAGNLDSLADIEAEFGGSRYFFVKADIADRAAVDAVFEEYAPDAVAHFAAESHVDRSIHGPEDFVRTNVMGSFNLLDAARKAWAGRDGALFHHVSTDEVFGSLGPAGKFTEATAYDPRSPYSASKAASDHLARAYHHTYGLPLTMSNCSNNYGPYQFPEKLIPLMIANMLEGKPLPVYGDGKNIRDWLYVEDHNSAVWLIMNQGRVGESYNIGGENEWENIVLVERLCEIVADKVGKPPAAFKKLIAWVKDRPGHDRRYAIDCSKIKAELGWKQSVDFDEGLSRTVDWYLANGEWIARIKSGAYKEWIERNYGAR